MIPFDARSESVKVVFPWSTCAMMQKLRMCAASAARDVKSVEERSVACSIAACCQHSTRAQNGRAVWGEAGVQSAMYRHGLITSHWQRS